LRPWCADLFADADLRRLCPVRHVPLASYPDGLLDALSDAPPGPVMYTGALENSPRLLARIDRPLWGNPPDIVCRVRSPGLLAAALREAGLPSLAVRATAEDGRRWLLKPRRGAGGQGIAFYAGQAFDPRRHYLQEFREGEPAAALYLGRPDGTADLLAVTLQIVGAPWLHAGRFQYAGSIGPVAPPSADELCRLGDLLAGRFGLRGLFGVDGIVDDGHFWPVEVNPRYTASVEVVERAQGVALLAAQRAVFEGRPIEPMTPASPLVAGKAILFARDDLIFPAGAFPDCADIPHPGERFERGRPVLTCFAAGATVAACRASLQETARHLDRRLFGR
jgi:predicted ATP-grasp superfamily ATP-dependent carboligase